MTTTVTDVHQPNYGSYRQTQQPKLELTPEEAKDWQACVKNSNFLMPGLIGAAMGYGTCRIIPLRANVKYGAIIGGILGLISGRIVASQMCLMKIASSPNSTLRDRLIEAGFYGNNRPTKEYQYQDFQPTNMQSETQSSEELSAGVIFDDYPSMNAHDAYSSFNDSGDLHIIEDTDLTEPINMQKGVSYDELRHKNRDDFYQKNKQRYTRMPEGPPPLANERNQRVPTSSSSPMHEKTKYGDVWG